MYEIILTEKYIKRYFIESLYDKLTTAQYELTGNFAN